MAYIKEAEGFLAKLPSILGNPNLQGDNGCTYPPYNFLRPFSSCNKLFCELAGIYLPINNYQARACLHLPNV